MLDIVGTSEELIWWMASNDATFCLNIGNIRRKVLWIVAIVKGRGGGGLYHGHNLTNQNFIRFLPQVLFLGLGPWVQIRLAPHHMPGRKMKIKMIRVAIIPHSMTDNEFFVHFEKAYSMLRDRFGTSHDFQKYTSICWFGCLSQHLVVHWWINVTCSFFFCLPDLKMQLFHPTYLIKKKCHHQIKNKWFSSLSYI